MPQDPIDRLREKALDPALPTADFAREVGNSDPSNRTVVRGSSDATAPSLPASSAPPSPPGARPFGRYLLLQELGHGGMGVVWKAWDTQLRRHVALKGMLSEEYAEDAQVERFMREARAAARLSHPHIIPVHDVGEHEGHHYFTSELIDGRPLDDVMKAPVPVRQALAWVKAIAEALQYAHQQGIVHRDVKPGNVLIDQGGEPHVMDFGLARHVDPAGEKTAPTLTVSGELLGTPRYMSPEQTRGAQGAGPPSDQFSLGVVLYELLAGRPAFEALDMRSLLNAIAEKEPVRPTLANARVHRDLETICLKALEKDPARRYATIGELAADLGRYLDGEPIQARPATGLARLWKKAARHKAVVVAAAAGLVAALGACAFAVVMHFRHVRELGQALDRVTRANRQTEDALSRERAARSVLEKSYAVSTVFSRWGALMDPLRAMEGVFYDVRLSTEEKRKGAAPNWEEVRRFMETTDADSASQATMWALAGWGRRLAGYPEEGEAWMEKATATDPDVPYGALLLAMVRFSDYMDLQPLPETWAGADAGVSFAGLPDETPEMRRDREAVVPLLAQADRAKVWGSREAREPRAAIEAMRSLQRGAFQEAAKRLSDALGGPTLRWMEASLLLARGRARYLAADLAGAKADLRKVIEARPGDADAWNDLGLIVLAGARLAPGDTRTSFAEAIEDFGHAAALEPGRALFHRNLGSARGDAGDRAHALADLDEAIRLDPRCAQAWVDRGTVRAETGNFDGAISDLDEGIRLDPASAAAWFDRGKAHASKGDLDAAIHDDSEAIRLDPRLAQAWLDRAAVRLAKGDVDAALADYDEAIRLAPRMAAAWYNRGNARRAKRDGKGAIGDYGEAIRLDPRLGQAWHNRGITRLDLGDLDGAIADLDEAIRLDGRDAERHVARGVAWEKKGDRARAIADFEEALSLAPKEWPNRKPIEAEIKALRGK